MSIYELIALHLGDTPAMDAAEAALKARMPARDYAVLAAALINANAAEAVRAAPVAPLVAA